MFRKVGLAVAALEFAAAIACHTTPAAAQGGVRVGTLSCNVASGWGFVFGSSKALNCTFSPGPGGHPEHYAGSISKFGVDIGYTQGGVLIWGYLRRPAIWRGGRSPEVMAAPPRAPRSGSGPGPMC